jgi:hypothetical protein
MQDDEAWTAGAEKRWSQGSISGDCRQPYNRSDYSKTIVNVTRNLIEQNSFYVISKSATQE